MNYYKCADGSYMVTAEVFEDETPITEEEFIEATTPSREKKEAQLQQLLQELYPEAREQEAYLVKALNRVYKEVQ